MSKRGKQDDHYQTSENFQIEIGKALTQLSKHTPNLILINNLVEGVTRLIPSLLENPEQVEVAVRLLRLPDGLWSWSYSKVFIPDYLDHDLKLMQKFASVEKNLTFKLTSHDEWYKILGEISNFWKNSSVPKLEYYKPLADLFEKLEDQPKLAAFFSHIAYGRGKVSKRMFSQLASRDGWHSNVYGVQVERKVTFLDLLFLLLLKDFEIRGSYMRVGVALAILLVTFSGGLAIGRVTAFKSEYSNLTGETNSSPTSSATPTTEPKIDKKILNKAVEEFDNETQVAIEDLIKNADGNVNEQYEQKIMQILGLKNTNSDSITNLDDKTKQDLVIAIYNYQQAIKGFDKPDGIIEKGGKTANKIEEKFKNNPAK
ncbi:MAG: hypothetical protein RSE13_05785 [Planktothrix sp. GU0601_MAG3]|nr:MAG: hypothetical protein RSE13_05785 [Planktothrix sp. GU0601_MAG3]